MIRSPIREALNKRRDRTIAVILGFKERECDEYLPPEVSLKLRKAILDGINDLNDLACDLIGSSDGYTVNELWLEKLKEIHEAVVSSNGT